MPNSRLTPVICAAVGLALATCAGCPTRGSKLIANESSIRTSLQDIDNMMSGYVSLAEGRDIEISRTSILVPVTVNRPAQSERELELIGERVCQHVMDTLTGLDIQPHSDGVTIEVHLLPPGSGPATDAGTAPAELGISRYDCTTDEIAFSRSGN